MRLRQRSLPGMDGPRRISKAETFGAVQQVMLAILQQRGHATADDLREYLDIEPAGLPVIGRAIGHMSETGRILVVGHQKSRRKKAHARSIQIWRLDRDDSPLAGPI